MRMTPHQFSDDALDHVVKGERTALLGEAGVKDYLQEQITEFVSKISQIPPIDRIGYLVGLLDGVRGNAGEVLLTIPGAATDRITKPGHDFQ